MLDPDVRPAVGDDVGQLIELEVAARASLIDARGGSRWLTEHPLVGSSWPDRIARGGVFVAELNVAGMPPVVVGYLAIDLAVPVASVEQVYIEPEARELGFGDALLAAAIAAARGAGARIFEGEALPGDRDTKNLYERAGITARLITLSTTI